MGVGSSSVAADTAIADEASSDGPSGISLSDGFQSRFIVFREDNFTAVAFP